MSKCDWCRHSTLKNGMLVCPFACCVMPQYRLDELVRKLGKHL